MAHDPWSQERVKKDRRAPTAEHHRKRARAPQPSRGSSLMLVAGLGVGGYLLYSFFNKAHAANAQSSRVQATLANPYTPAALNASAPGVSFAPSAIQPGVLVSTQTAIPAVTAGQVAQANDFWNSLSPVVPLASGYITFPSGSQSAAALFGGGNTAMDGNGNLYVQWAGQVYQLGAADSAGNYPAQLVAGGYNTTGAGMLSVPSMVANDPNSPWLGL